MSSPKSWWEKLRIDGRGWVSLSAVYISSATHAKLRKFGRKWFGSVNASLCSVPGLASSHFWVMLSQLKERTVKTVSRIFFKYLTTCPKISAATELYGTSNKLWKWHTYNRFNCKESLEINVLNLYCGKFPQLYILKVDIKKQSTDVM